MPSEKIRAAMAVFEGSEEMPARDKNEFWKSECDEWKRSASANLQWSEQNDFGRTGICGYYKWGRLTKMQAAHEYFEGRRGPLPSCECRPFCRSEFLHRWCGIDEYERREWCWVPSAKIVTAMVVFEANEESPVRRNANVVQSECNYWERLNRRNSPLLRLPGEVRNIIYGYLTPYDVEIDFENDGIRRIYLPYDGGLGDVDMVQVCRQIWHEVVSYIGYHKTLRLGYETLRRFKVWTEHLRPNAFRTFQLQMYEYSNWADREPTIAELAQLLRPICKEGVLKTVILSYHWKPEKVKKRDLLLVHDRYQGYARELSSLLSSVEDGSEVNVKYGWYNKSTISDVDVVEKPEDAIKLMKY